MSHHHRFDDSRNNFAKAHAPMHACDKCLNAIPLIKRATFTKEGRLWGVNQETLKVNINTIIWTIIRRMVTVIPSNGALGLSEEFLKKSSDRKSVV